MKIQNEFILCRLSIHQEKFSKINCSVNRELSNSELFSWKSSLKFILSISFFLEIIRYSDSGSATLTQLHVGTLPH